MPYLNLPEPPTETAYAEARRTLALARSSVSELTHKIDTAESALAQIVADSKCAINELVRERLAMEDQVFRTMAYLSPIRRLPNELLREIFLCHFEDYPVCAWGLAAVCTMWRRLALSMPRIWSKIRLITTQNSSADTIRLWLERSGDSVPLDIEIYLRVTKSQSETVARPRRSASPPTWALSFPPHHGLSTHYVIPHATHTITNLPILPPAHTPIIIPPSAVNHDPWGVPSLPSQERLGPSSKASHWGHIAIYYLVEQMHRWERFVFRFDKQFSSMGALKSITGDAPMLKEFEISSAEAAFYAEWPWLPSASATSSVVLPRLETLTLQYTPFKWSSPMLCTNLRSLNLRALPTSHLPLDRVLFIVAANPALETLSLHFAGILPAILPLTPTSLPELKSLSIGGHYLLSQLVESFILPAVDTLSFDIEARDPIEDTIANLLTRSNNPPVTHLALAYGNTSNASTFYYGPGGIVISWTFLAELGSLQSLHVGGTPLEPLLAALGPPDDESNHTQWACPNLTSLAMKNCHSHSEGVAKLVQMVDARNPDSSGSTTTSGGITINGVTPVKLRQMELYDCASLGQDVVKWLKARIDDVTCTEPTFERASLRSPFM